MIEEPQIPVLHREQLAYLLTEAAEIEHGLMCCYLYAAYSLKRDVAEGLEPKELEAVNRWRATINDVAREEMLHLALVSNLQTAVGTAPHFLRPNLPVAPGYHPSGIVLSLAPFDANTIDHFVYMERPEGVDTPDGEGFAQAVPYERPPLAGKLMPNAQEYLTVGHLYRAIRHGLRELVGTLGEKELFCGDPAGQVDASVYALDGLSPITDLASAEAVIDRILLQGEGGSDAHSASHYCRFLSVRDEFRALRKERPTFEPARPVAKNPVMRKPVIAEGHLFVDARPAAEVLDLANAIYTLIVRLIGRMFGPTDETDAERRALGFASIELMQVLTATSDVLTTLPANLAQPGVNAGVTFACSRSLDALPQHEAAWRIFRERGLELAKTSDGLAKTEPRLAPVAARLTKIAARLVSPRSVTRPAASPTRTATTPVTSARPDGDAMQEPLSPPPTPESNEDGIETVRGKHVLLHFDSNRCIHSRHCVLGAPKVFRANVKGPWLDPDATTVESFVAVAHACPSGAITYDRVDGGPGEPIPDVNVLRLRENGPLGFTADLHIDGQPDRIRATLCRCGASKKKPFCDGSHNAIKFVATGEPETIQTEPLAERGGALQIVPTPNGPLRVTGNLEICAGTGRTVKRVTSTALCRCGGSSKKPFCDGTHARIGFTSE
ncbi:MAG TPA: ferritin-like domain-containing protein [Polyangiaceae bacterium]|nr:ferritin-like domain-containing protein [Polyangiaceae bacterium]